MPNWLSIPLMILAWALGIVVLGMISELMSPRREYDEARRAHRAEEQVKKEIGPPLAVRRNRKRPMGRR